MLSTHFSICHSLVLSRNIDIVWHHVNPCRIELLFFLPLSRFAELATSLLNLLTKLILLLRMYVLLWQLTIALLKSPVQVIDLVWKRGLRCIHKLRWDLVSIVVLHDVDVHHASLNIRPSLLRLKLLNYLNALSSQIVALISYQFIIIVHWFVLLFEKVVLLLWDSVLVYLRHWRICLLLLVGRVCHIWALSLIVSRSLQLIGLYEWLWLVVVIYLVPVFGNFCHRRADFLNLRPFELDL